MKLRTFLLFVTAISACDGQQFAGVAQSVSTDVMTLSGQDSPAPARIEALALPRRRTPRLPVMPLAARRPDAVGVSPEPAGAATAVGLNGFPAVMDDLTTPFPEPAGAVGPQHVVTMANSLVQFQSRTGTVIASMPLEKFWSGLPFTDAVAGPRIVYDPAARRWIASAVSIVDRPTSALLIGASQTADPTGKWTLFRIPVDPNRILYGGYGVLGFNGNWVTASLDIFKGPEYQGTLLFVFAKGDLYSGKATFRVFSNDQGPFVPATDYDNTNPKRMFLLQEDFGVFAGLIVSEIQGDVGAEVFLSGRGFVKPPDLWDVAPRDSFNFAPQLGSAEKLDTNDSRLQNCVLRNGSVWCTQTIFLPVNNPRRTAVQWWQINPTQYQIQQRGRIDDPTGAIFYAFPSIAVNKNGDVLIGYNRFSANQYAGANFSFRAAADPPGTTQPDTVFKPGEAPYRTRRGTDNLWGDYSTTVVDPLDDLGFWTIQEYANSPMPDGTPTWGTWWAQIMPLAAGKSCTWSISRAAQQFTAAGGSASVDVTTTAGCNWMAAANASWVAIAAGANGNASGTVAFNVSANPSTASRTGTLLIAGQTLTITQAAAPPAPDLLITGLTAPSSATPGGQFAASATVKNQGTTRAAAFRVGFYFASAPADASQDIFSGSFCTVDQGLAAGASTNCDVQVTVPATVKPGTYYLRAVADDQNAIAEDHSNNSRTADSGTISIQPVAVTIAPSFTAGAVVNAASLQGGAVAPGEAVIVTGDNMGPADLQMATNFQTALAESRLLFDGVAAPLRFVSKTKISAFVPFGVASQSVTRVEVEYKGTRSAAVNVPVAPSAPGILTVADNGQGQGLIFNPDGSANAAGSPAMPLDVVSFQVTGAGQTDPPGEDGKLAGDPPAVLILPVSVSIGGLDARVAYAGPSPGLINGMIRVDAEIPADVQPDSSVPLVVTVGTVPSAPVTLAVAPAAPAGTTP